MVGKSEARGIAASMFLLLEVSTALIQKSYIAGKQARPRLAKQSSKP